MADLFSPYVLAAWPHPATGDLLPGLATVVAWLVSHVTAAALTVLSWLPALWMRVAAPLALVALAVWWVRHVNRPAKLGRPPRRRLTRPVDQRQSDGER